VWSNGLSAAFIWLWALVGGTFLGPALLPWLPGRAFAAKGLILGVVLATIALIARAHNLVGLSGNFELLTWLALVPAVSSFLLMNFTGSSTYTSLSGVKVEMRRYVPLQIGLAALGLVLFIISRLVA
jgi:acetyl-CoA decarbonylase/synthase complex subunit gamma